MLAVIWGVLLTACAPTGGQELPPEPEEGVLIYAALNPVKKELREYIERFNKRHEDVQIVVRDYSDENGVQRLLTELALGQVPDIMEMQRFGEGKDNPYAFDAYKARPEGEYWMPYRQMAQKGYLEDLWPYIENDPSLGLDDVLMPPLKAAEVNGGLYMIFPEFTVTTMTAAEHIVGDRWGQGMEELVERYTPEKGKKYASLVGTEYLAERLRGWTLGELTETFAAMPEGSTILRLNAVRRDVYDMLCAPLLEQYVDMETGETSFDSQGFQDMLAFLGSFPEEFKTTLSEDNLKADMVERMLTGRQLLEAVTFRTMESITSADTFWGTPLAVVGYPTADGSLGSYFNLHGSKLAMSATCRYKEAAWEFMRRELAEKHTYAELQDMKGYGAVRKICVNLANYNQAIDYELTENLWIDMSTNRTGYFSGPLGERLFEVDLPSEYDLARFEMLVSSTTQIYWPDSALSDIVWEAVGPYFAGDRSLEETVGMIDKQVRLYVNENR